MGVGGVEPNYHILILSEGGGRPSGNFSHFFLFFFKGSVPNKTLSGCSLEEDTKYSGHNLYTTKVILIMIIMTTNNVDKLNPTKGIKVGNMAGCAALCFEDSKCKFWTYNPR